MAVVPARLRLTLAALALAGAGCGGGADTAVVYTALEPALVGWAEDAFRASHPGFRVRFEEMDDDQAMDRLRGEAESPIADLWWGAPAWRLEGAAAQGLVAETRPPWLASVPPGLADPDGRWVGSLVDPLVLAFNSDSLSRSRAPRDWVDLRHPRWSGELVLAEPGPVDAMTALLAHRLWTARAEHGDATEGLDEFASFDAWRAAYVPDAREAARLLRAGRGVLAILPLSVAEEARASGGVDYRLPETASPLLVQGVALVAGGPHPEAAAAFLAWLGSEEAASGLMQRVARLPAVGFPRPVGDGSGAEWYARVIPGLRPAYIPVDSVAPLLDGWVELWKSDVRGRTPTFY